MARKRVRRVRRKVTETGSMRRVRRVTEVWRQTWLFFVDIKHT